MVPVKIPIPVASNTIPQIFWIKDSLFFNLVETVKNLLIKSPEIMKGIANPSEYVDKSIIPE